MKLACIILNYNSFVETSKLINKVRKFSVLDYIIVVDNKSTDDSYVMLSKKQNNRVHVIQANRNGGFGYGNNLGVNYANNLGVQHALIVNPDVDFKEEIILPMIGVFEQREDAAVVVPASYKNNSIRAYHVQSNLQVVISSSLIMNKFFGGFLGRLKPNARQLKETIEIGIFSGALFMIDINRFIRVGMFDENVFLYFEESILAEKIHNSNFNIYMVPNITFKHVGSKTVIKSVSSLSKIKKYEVASKKYFLKEYRGVGNIKSFLYSFIFEESILEMYLYGFLKKLTSNV